MALETGMRMGEILNLKWENLNLCEGNIYVIETKTNETRYLPISNRLRETLIPLRPGLPEEPVFQYKGKAIGTFRTAFNAALRRSGVDKFTFHDLRHTFASVLVMKGVDLATVQELLGHKSIVMTKRYSHPTPEHKRRAIELLDMGPVDTYLDTKVTSIDKKQS
jgi:integrase